MGATFVLGLADELVETGRLRADLARELTDILPPDNKLEAVFHRDADGLAQLVEVHSLSTGELRATLTPRRDDQDMLEAVLIEIV